MSLCVFVCAGLSWTTPWQNFHFLSWYWQEWALRSPHWTGKDELDASVQHTKLCHAHLSTHFNYKNLIPWSKRRGTKPLTKCWSLKKRIQNNTEAPNCQTVTTLHIQIKRIWCVFWIFKIMFVCTSKSLPVCIYMWQRDPVIHYRRAFAGICWVELIKPQ